MHLNEMTPDASLEFKALVYELLGLDPAMLVKMDTETNSIAVGLNLLLRRTLERAIGSIWAKDEAVFRLQTDATAQALGWPDAATMDLSTLFAFALVCAARRVRGLAYIPLCPADTEIDETPFDRGDLLTASKGVAVAVMLLKEGILEMRNTSALGTTQVMSVCALIKERLGLQPKDLVRSIYATQREANRAFARDPEGQVVIALAAFLINILEGFQAAVAQNIQSIRLLIWDPDSGRASLIRQANISSLLTGALLAEGGEGRDVAFLVHSTAPVRRP